LKVVIFAGGQGTRLYEETEFRPKPMIEVGEHPILWHIMKIFSHHGINDFIICTGYKGSQISDYFANYYQRNSDVTFSYNNNGKVDMTFHRPPQDNWSVTVVDTGQNTLTAGRLALVQDYIGDEDFCLTYGDGVSDVNISELIKFHKSHEKIATVTAVQPPGRFGALDIKGDKVEQFVEKPIGDKNWINGGFFVLKPDVFDYLPENSADEMWEGSPLTSLADDGQLQAFRHGGFWQAMDTLRDKFYLEKLYTTGAAPWISWK